MSPPGVLDSVEFPAIIYTNPALLVSDKPTSTVIEPAELLASPVLIVICPESPAFANPEKIDAKYNDGILKLSIPKNEQTKLLPKKEIKVG
jgi:hypothetical protein